MNHKINGNTAAFLKRQARRISKTLQVSHRVALDIAAANAGFTNWKCFLKKLSSSILLVEKTIAIKEIPLQKEVERFERNELLIMNPYRKLLVAATNELLDRKLISLDANEDPHPDNNKGHILIDLFGYNSVVLWQDIGFEELRISVWWKYNHQLHPQANLKGNSRENFNCSTPLAAKELYKSFVGVTASGWLERMTSKHLQGIGDRCILDKYTRRGEKVELEKLPIPQPKGFQPEGKFFI